MGIALLFYGLFVNTKISEIPVYHYIIMGIICGIISQIGDWSASAVKRYAKIKDYGTIMPGHGGVLDRFDSILFSAPVIYFYLVFFINFDGQLRFKGLKELDKKNIHFGVNRIQ